MPELKTNTVKHVYSLRITSETESWQTIVTAESLAEALKIAAEQRAGLDRRTFSPICHCEEGEARRGNPFSSTPAL